MMNQKQKETLRAMLERIWWRLGLEGLMYHKRPILANEGEGMVGYSREFIALKAVLAGKRRRDRLLVRVCAVETAYSSSTLPANIHVYDKHFEPAIKTEMERFTQETGIRIRLVPEYE